MPDHMEYLHWRMSRLPHHCSRIPEQVQFGDLVGIDCRRRRWPSAFCTRNVPGVLHELCCHVRRIAQRWCSRPSGIHAVSVSSFWLYVSEIDEPFSLCTVKLTVGSFHTLKLWSLSIISITSIFQPNPSNIVNLCLPIWPLSAG